MRALVTACLLACAIASASLAAENGATTQPDQHGPDTVVLRELVKLYKPVPFDHKSHAEMAEMWEGCTTCHHRNPEPPKRINPASVDHHDQEQAGKIPACKSCHEISPAKVDIHMPTLKGAYHRQCLNCHRDWANENSCTKCHEPINGVTESEPTADDIVDRMHPPIAAPDVKVYKTRFTPAVGALAIFRHDEHATKYGLKCVNCHRNDNCASCHSAKPDAPGPQLLLPGRTWKETHGPCMRCHEQDRCRTCHYDEAEPPPAPFAHSMTGQLLDKDHSKLSCGQCHPVLKARKVITCGDASCHRPRQRIAYPAKRPGKVVSTQPADKPPSTKPVVQIINEPTGTIKRVRRGP